MEFQFVAIGAGFRQRLGNRGQRLDQSIAHCVVAIIVSAEQSSASQITVVLLCFLERADVHANSDFL
jgi:hypothetical protein